MKVMDSNKCHDYIGSNDIRSHAAYMGNREIRSNDIMAVPQNQYYNNSNNNNSNNNNNSLAECVVTANTTTNTLGSRADCSLLPEKRKICACNRNVMCNNCRLQASGVGGGGGGCGGGGAAAESWTTKTPEQYAAAQRRDYALRSEPPILPSVSVSSTQQTTRKSMRFSPMYIQQQQQQQQHHQQQQQQVPSHIQSQQLQQSQSLTPQILASTMDASNNKNINNNKVENLANETILNNNNNNSGSNRMSYWNPGVEVYVNDHTKNNSKIQSSTDININRRPGATLHSTSYNQPPAPNVYNPTQSLSSQSTYPIAKIIPQQQKQLPPPPPQPLAPIANANIMSNHQQQQHAGGNVTASMQYANVGDPMTNSKDRNYDPSIYTSNTKTAYQINTSCNINVTPTYDNNTNHQYYTAQQQPQTIQYSHHTQQQQNLLHNHHQPQQHHHQNNPSNVQGQLSKGHSKSHQVVNPSNLPAPKDQHPSPNYGRKCPQIFSTEEQNNAHHHHLYMSTPQFSSDKFMTTVPQKPQQQQLHGADSSKIIRESSVHLGHPTGPGIGASSANSNSSYMFQDVRDKYHKPRESPQQQYHNLPSTRSVSPSYAQSAANCNYNPSINPLNQEKSSSRNNSIEAVPMALKQQSSQQFTPGQYQQFGKAYQSSSVTSLTCRQQKSIPLQPVKPLNASPSIGTRTNVQSPIVDYVKREEIHHTSYENASRQTLPVSRNMYINPYNTPPPTVADSYCKELTHTNTPLPYTTNPTATTPNYREESPLCYPTKYAKLSAADSLTHPINNKHPSVINQNTPPPSRAPSQRSQQQAGYYYDGNYHSSVPSPAVATAASPSPSSLLSTTSQTQLHQNDYIVSQMGPSTPSGPAMPLPPSHSYIESPYAPTHRYQSSPIDGACSNYDKLRTPPLHQQQQLLNHMSNGQPQQLTTVKNVGPQNSHSKTQTTGKQQKPNYRELINEKIAERNATSEEELNLQIIKKTLNVNPQTVRNSFSSPHSTNRAVAGSTESTVVPLVHQTSALPSIPVVINDRGPVVRPEILIQQSHNKAAPKEPLIVMPQTHSTLPMRPVNVAETNQVVIEHESDKPTCASSPLDLSMRTVKTKADSTEYKYQQKPHYQQLTPPPQLQQKPTSMHPMKQKAQASSTSASTLNHPLDNRYTLPRVDFTPNFSVHTLESTSTPTAAVKDSILPPNKNNVPVRTNCAQSNTTSPYTHFANNYSQNSIVAVRNNNHNNSPAPNSLNSYPLPQKEQPYNTAHVISKSNINFTSNRLESATTNGLNGKDQVNGAGQRGLDFRYATSAPTQSRPSVVETNPYASVIKIESSKNCVKHHALGVVDRLPPDTSIMALPPRSTCIENAEKPHIAHIGSVLTTNSPNVKQTSSTYSSACEKNPNFLGRKRHLKDYSNREEAVPPKRLCCPDSIESSYLKFPQNPQVRPVDISVIALNERALPCAVEKRISSCPKVDVKPPAPVLTPVITTALTSVSLNNRLNSNSLMPVICKQETVTTPPADISRSIVTKSEPNVPYTGIGGLGSQQQAAARIRTKAELKGFTFNTPPILVSNNVAVNPLESKITMIKQEEIKKIEIKIEEENPIVQTKVESSTAVADSNEKFNENTLLDFGFNNTCKNFMEQLQARNQIANKRAKVTFNNNCTPVGNRHMGDLDTTVQTKLNQNDNCRLFHNESPETTGSSALFDCVAGDSASINFRSISFESQNSSQTSSTAQKKISKSERDKKRSQQEKRLAERLKTKESSSESEDELDKRKTERLKKPTLKSKTKHNSKIIQTTNNGISTSHGSVDSRNKNHFSECGSDSTNDDTDEEIKGPINKPAGKSEKNEKLQSKGNGKRKESMRAEEKKLNDKQTLSTIEKDQVALARSGKVFSKKSKEETSDTSINNKGEIKDGMNQIKKQGKSLMLQNITKRKDKGRNKSNGQSLKFSKFGLNTMTRSKLKKELETQLANSKVLRNEKIIRNSTSKIKRKYVRKYGNTVVGNIVTDGAGGLSREAGIIKSTRLKAKLERNGGCKTAIYKKEKSKTVCKNGTTHKIHSNSNHLKQEGGKLGEQLQKETNDLMLEVYRFKRSLKVPPSLITIKHPGGNPKIAASLPDLERHAEAFEKKKKKSVGKVKAETGASKTSLLSKASLQTERKHMSIIDLLHSRVTKYSGGHVVNAASKKSTGSMSMKKLHKPFSPYKSNSMNNCGVYSETSQTTESSELQMLPELKKDSEDEDDDDNESHHSSSKKRHFSIFDTKVLPAKTRNESKRQQKRENIREIFVGDDRPASAPPEIVTQIANAVGDCETTKQVNKRMTYEQKYEQFLQQMNIVINEDKLGRFNRISKLTPSLASSLASRGMDNGGDCGKEQKNSITGDIENTNGMNIDDLKSNNKSNNIKTQSSHKEVREDERPENFRRRRRPGKYLRRKGSSGFDYIKKKKKKPPPTSGAMGGHGRAHAIAPTATALHSKHHHFERSDDDIGRVKTEDDVGREIQKWVLNKGVGQSTMHKAARQGYIDVVVYCLDRLGVNPDLKDNAGYTPLHEACTNGWLNIARVLLQYGANHSAAAHSGIRPLHEASENDHEEIVRLLLSYGADPLLATYAGQTPLMLAASPTITDLIKNHLTDVQSMTPSERKPWKFDGPWQIFDPAECGYNVLEGAPIYICDMRRPTLRKSSSNVMLLQTNKKLHQRIINAYNNGPILTQNVTTTTTTAAAITNVDINYATNNNNNNRDSKDNTTTTSSEDKFDSIFDNDMAKSFSPAPAPSLSIAIATTTTIATAATTTIATAATKTTTTLSQQQQQSPIMDKCAVVLDNIDRCSTFRLLNETNPEILVENSDSEGEIVEFEESDVLLPPLYLLKDENSNDKWVLLSDLCNLLKVKSKETLLNKIYPPSSSTSTILPKGLVRELKTSDFLEKTTCLQLLCAGEKLNLNASKVVLIKYNENVRNLLGVNAFLMKF